MFDELSQLIDLFRAHGGKLENVKIGYREESGYYCATIDNSRDVEIYCPEHLLVRADDIGITESGLYIAKPDKYVSNISFIEKYFSFHFNKKLVDRILEEEQQLESLSEQACELLASIHIRTKSGNVNDCPDTKLEQAKKRILQYHQLFYDRFNSSVIMPFITFANHDQSGNTYKGTKYHGIAITGRFTNEIFAHYSDGDVLMILNDYRFVADTPFVYSLPMWFQLPDGIKIEVNRDIKEFTLIDDQLRFPKVEKNGDKFVISWFPLFSNIGPYYPARIASYIAQKVNIPGEIILHLIYRQNLNSLLPVIFDLKDNKNNFLRLVVSAVKRQLELISGIPN